jgi:hypothetical protein
LYIMFNKTRTGTSHRLIIKGNLPNANKYISALSRNRFVGGKLKKESTAVVYYECKAQKLPYIIKPCDFQFKWFVKNRKMDKDNIAFAKKFVLDGLVMAKVITNDTWFYVNSFTDEFFIDAKNPRIEVIINEV